MAARRRGAGLSAARPRRPPTPRPPDRRPPPLPAAARRGCRSRVRWRRPPTRTAGGIRLRPSRAPVPQPGSVRLGVDEAFELPAADRVLQLLDRLGLDLAHALAGDVEAAADL